MSKSLVNKATVDSRDNTQGFHLRELAQLTKGSIDDSQTIEDALVKRLKKDKPNVKRKALKCIKYIAEHGSNSFRMAFQRHSQLIRDCAQYRGPPDPIYGEAPYEEVRRAAKECMDSLFRTTNTEQERQIRERIVGMGSDNSNNFGSSGSYSGSGKKYEGYGTKPEPKENKSMTSKMWGYFGKKEEKKSYNTGSYGNNSSSYGNSGFGSSSYGNNDSSYGGPSGPASYSTTELDASTSRKGKFKAGVPGGVWGNPQSAPKTSQLSSSTNFGRKGSDEDFGGKVKSKATSNGDYEQKIIDAATGVSGVKPQPSQAELKKFVTQYQSLDQDQCAEILAVKLESDSWQQQLRSLYLIQAILKSGHGDNLEEYLQDNQDLIENLLNVKKRPVRQKAKEVAKLLGIKSSSSKKTTVAMKVAPVAAAPTPVQPQQAPQQQADLLDFMNPTTTASAEPTVAATGDMFGNMDLGNSDLLNSQNTSFSFTNDSTQSAQTSMMFDPNASSAPSAVPASNDQRNDGFLFTATPSQPQTTQPPVQNTQSTPKSLLDFTAPAQAQQPATTQVNFANQFSKPSVSAGFPLGMQQQTNPSFSLQQPSQTSFTSMQPQPSFPMTSQQPSMMGLMQQPNIMQTQQGMMMGMGMPQQQPNIMGMNQMGMNRQGMMQNFNTNQMSQPNQAMGMNMMNMGMQQQQMNSGLMGMSNQNSFQKRNSGGFNKRNSAGLDPFANLMQQKVVPKPQQAQKQGQDAFADLVSFN